jgi:type VI secretion system secreted protein Hcp
MQNVPSASSHAKPAGQTTNVDMFMKITGNAQGVIKGESYDSKHLGEIEVESYSWDIVQPYDKTGSGLATGKRQLGLFTFSMRSQVATPKLMQACCTGEHLKTAVFTCRKAGGQQQEYMKWTLTNAMVVNLKTGCVGGIDLLPHDQISLTFRKIEVDYKEQKADGTLGGGIMFMDDLII